jgi:hypothetical protein
MTTTAATLHQDIPCIRCGYDLRGLSDDGLCPECGTSIATSTAQFAAKSAASPPLAQAPRIWVMKLAIGCTLLALLALAAFAISAAQLAFDPDWRVAWTPVEIFMVIAFWLIAAREPTSRAYGRTSDQIVRWSIRLAAPAIAAWMLLRVPGSIASLRWPSLFAFVTATTTACVMFQLARLAARIPRGNLRLEAIAAMVILPIAMFTQVVFFSTITLPNGRFWWTLPEPVFGEANALMVVPYAYLNGLPWNGEMLFWTALAIVMLWTLTLLPRLAFNFWRAAAARRTGGHDAA